MEMPGRTRGGALPAGWGGGCPTPAQGGGRRVRGPRRVIGCPYGSWRGSVCGGRFSACCGGGLGGVAVVALGLFLSRHYLGLGMGGMERVAAFPVLVWACGVGGWGLVRPPALVPRPGSRRPVPGA